MEKEDFEQEKLFDITFHLNDVINAYLRLSNSDSPDIIYKYFMDNIADFLNKHNEILELYKTITSYKEYNKNETEFLLYCMGIVVWCFRSSNWEEHSLNERDIINLSKYHRDQVKILMHNEAASQFYIEQNNYDEAVKTMYKSCLQVGLLQFIWNLSFPDEIMENYKKTDIVNDVYVFINLINTFCFK